MVFKSNNLQLSTNQKIRDKRVLYKNVILCIRICFCETAISTRVLGGVCCSEISD